MGATDDKNRNAYHEHSLIGADCYLFRLLSTLIHRVAIARTEPLAMLLPLGETGVNRQMSQAAWTVVARSRQGGRFDGCGLE
jgi:hypothetical protein